MKKTLLFIALVSTSFITHSFSQVTNTNANIVIMPNTTVECLQYYNNQALGNTDLRGTLDVNETVTNDGVMIGVNNSLLTLTGTSEQLVNGSSTILLYDYEVNNAGNGATQDNTVRVTNRALLTNGKLFTNDASPIQFTSTALNPSESNANRIVGTAIMEPRTIGVGAFPLFLDLSMAAGANLGDVQLIRHTGHGTGNTLAPAPSIGYATINGNQSIDCYWTIEPTVGQLTATRSATFTWLSDLDNAKDLNSMQLWRTMTYNTIANPWFPIFYPPIPMLTRTHTENIDQIFNSWTFSDIINPLPVEFLDFQVRPDQADAKVLWKTLEDEKVERYVVERSIDGSIFTAVGTIESLGTGSQQYVFIDKGILNLDVKAVYYRIRQLDADRSFKITSVRVLYLERSNDFDIKAYPNPFENTLIVNIENPKGEKVVYTLRDVLGRDIWKLESEETFLQVQLSREISNLASGTYMLHADSPSISQTIKLIHD